MGEAGEREGKPPSPRTRCCLPVLLSARKAAAAAALPSGKALET